MAPCARAGNRLVQGVSYAIAKPFFGGFVDLQVRGRAHCPRTGACLLAANHGGPFDPFLLTLAAGRWIDWVAMIELYRQPVVARYWQAMAAIPVDRARPDQRTVKTVLNRLAGGRMVGLFPEGGIRPPAQSVLRGGEINPGVCRLALAAGLPLLPVVILGSASLTQVSGWLWPRRAFKVRVLFGPPIPAEGAAADLSRRLCAAFRRLGDERLAG